MSPRYKVRVHQRARHVRLRLDPRDGLVVTVPPRFDQRRIPALLVERRDWINAAHERQAGARSDCDPTLLGPRPGRVELPALGRSWRVEYRDPEPGSKRRFLRLEAGEQSLALELPAGAEPGIDASIARLLKRWLKTQARAWLGDEVAALARRHGLHYRDVTIRHQRSRWGSCSAKQRLSLNARLLFCTPELCRYVLIHELVHTVHLDHSPAFWARVAELCPDYRAARAGLNAVWQRLPDWA